MVGVWKQNGGRAFSLIAGEKVGLVVLCAFRDQMWKSNSSVEGIVVDLLQGTLSRVFCHCLQQQLWKQ